MSQFAKDTNVSVDRSKAEIEKLLIKYGASGFLSGWNDTQAMIGFEAKGRRLKFILPLPSRDDPKYKYTPAKRFYRDTDQQYKAWEQDIRQRWRALALAIKAKLEAVESGISTFEDEFMAHIVLPGGQTVSEWLTPQIESAYQKNEMPPLLGHGG